MMMKVSILGHGLFLLISIIVVVGEPIWQDRDDDVGVRDIGGSDRVKVGRNSRVAYEAVVHGQAAALQRKGVVIDPLPAEELNVYDESLFEGDVRLTDEQRRQIEEAIEEEKTGQSTRKATAALHLRWDHNIVPYVIHSSSADDRDVIERAITHWEDNTCLDFVPWTSAVATRVGHNKRLYFFQQSGCWSYVGKVNLNYDTNPVSIGRGCAYLGIIAHEIGHAIGFFHEQSRPDRDDHVTILTNNIRSGRESNFEKYDTGTISTRSVPYDFRSIMHYSSKAFSMNGEPTIVTVDPIEMLSIGQRDALSFNDIKLANLIYDCARDCDTSLNCRNEGYIGPDCTCWCPDGYAGTNCQMVDPAYTPPCVERYTETDGLSGTIRSPNYPSDYGSNELCQYMITVRAGSTITIDFNTFELEPRSTYSDGTTACYYDYLEVFDAPLTHNGERSCGDALPSSYTSTNNQLRIVFKTDIAVHFQGFSLTYTLNVPATPTTIATTTQPPPPATTKTTTTPSTPAATTASPTTKHVATQVRSTKSLYSTTQPPKIIVKPPPIISSSLRARLSFWGLMSCIVVQVVVCIWT